MCLSYAMYDVHSYESKDRKILCIVSDFVMEKSGRVLEEFITCNYMRKNIIVDFYKWCNEAVMQKYILIFVRNISRINIKHLTTYWDLWSKWYIWHVIQVLHTIAHDS